MECISMIKNSLFTKPVKQNWKMDTNGKSTEGYESEFWIPYWQRVVHSPSSNIVGEVQENDESFRHKIFIGRVQLHLGSHTTRVCCSAGWESPQQHRMPPCITEKSIKLRQNIQNIQWGNLYFYLFFMSHFRRELVTA